jgi:hypothetical protein
MLKPGGAGALITALPFESPTLLSPLLSEFIKLLFKLFRFSSSSSDSSISSEEDEADMVVFGMDGIEAAALTTGRAWPNDALLFKGLGCEGAACSSSDDDDDEEDESSSFSSSDEEEDDEDDEDDKTPSISSSYTRLDLVADEDWASSEDAVAAL